MVLEAIADWRGGATPLKGISINMNCEHGGHWRFGSCKVNDEFIELVHRGESIDTWRCKVCNALLTEDPGTLLDLPPEQRPPGSRP